MNFAGAWQIGVLIFVAGGFYYTTKLSFASSKKDMDGIAGSLRREIGRLEERVVSLERNGSRRYHNLSLAITIAAPPKHEAEIAQLLKE